MCILLGSELCPIIVHTLHCCTSKHTYEETCFVGLILSIHLALEYYCTRGIFFFSIYIVRSIHYILLPYNTLFTVMRVCLGKIRIAGTVWSEGFVYKVAPSELRILPIMYFVIHNLLVLSKILKTVAPFWSLFAYVNYYQNNQIYRVKIDFLKFCFNGTKIFNILDNTTELWMTKYIIGKIFSSGGATLYKNPSDQSVS